LQDSRKPPLSPNEPKKINGLMIALARGYDEIVYYLCSKGAKVEPECFYLTVKHLNFDLLNFILD
jgi:hypothetical protein